MLLSSLGIILSIVFGVRAEKTKQDLEEYKKQEKKRDLWQNLNLDREEILQNACDCIKLIESAAPIAFDNAKLNTTLTKLKSELNRCIDRYKELLEENSVCRQDFAIIKSFISAVDQQIKLPKGEAVDFSNQGERNKYLDMLETIKKVFEKEFRLYE